MYGMANEIPREDFYRPYIADMIILVVCVVLYKHYGHLAIFIHIIDTWYSGTSTTQHNRTQDYKK